MATTRREWLVGMAALPGTAATIGARSTAEWKSITDPGTGRNIRQLTSAQANSYPLYYFVPTITADNRFLIFHSERTGWVQLYRMDLESGEIVQLTDGHTRESGWAVWCQPHLRGIYNHLSALNQTRREVYYFQDNQVRCACIDKLSDAIVHEMPGRMPIGQSGFSPDGRYFACIHADERSYRRAISDREALQNMQLFGAGHEQWRNGIPAEVGLIDTETRKYRSLIRLDYHVHHVVFLDNSRVLINHVQNDHGMWTVGLDGSGVRALRPRDAHGAIVHQVVTRRGLYYEAVAKEDGKTANWFGRYDPGTDSFEEVLLPVDGYVHTGLDPAGRFLFFENHGKTHELYSAHFPRHPEKRRFTRLRSMAPYPGSGGQRFHAHPALSPDRKSLIYTEVIDGFAQVCAMDVRELVDRDEYWDAV